MHTYRCAHMCTYVHICMHTCPVGTRQCLRALVLKVRQDLKDPEDPTDPQDSTIPANPVQNRGSPGQELQGIPWNSLEFLSYCVAKWARSAPVESKTGKWHGRCAHVHMCTCAHLPVHFC